MHADRKLNWEGDASDPVQLIEKLRSALELHREMVGQKAEIGEEPDRLLARLEEMAEDLDPSDLPSEAIRLLLEAERARSMQFEEVDRRIDQLTESLMNGSIGLFEMLGSPNDGGRRGRWKT